MSFFESKDTEAQRKRRLQDIENWLAFFKDAQEKCGISFNYLPGAAKTINRQYWWVLKEIVKPVLNKNEGHNNVDHHKIMSVFEVVIMQCDPIDLNDDKLKSNLTAKLAMFIARTIMISWAGRITNVIDLPSFEREHVTWLKRLNAEGRPYFSNAATWFLFEELCLAISQK